MSDSDGKRLEDGEKHVFELSAYWKDGQFVSPSIMGTIGQDVDTLDITIQGDKGMELSLRIWITEDGRVVLDRSVDDFEANELVSFETIQLIPDARIDEALAQLSRDKSQAKPR